MTGTALLPPPRLSLRHLGTGDGRLLAGLAGSLSEQTRRNRFFTSDSTQVGAWVAALLVADQTDHLVECMVVDEGFGETLVGVVEVVRDNSRADMGEFAAAVSDEWQGLGVGSLLTGRLARRSLEVGIRRWRSHRLIDNHYLAGLLEIVGEAELTASEHGVVSAVHRLA